MVRYLTISVSYGYGPTSANSTQPGQCPGVSELRLTYDWQYTRKGHFSNAGDTQEHVFFNYFIPQTTMVYRRNTLEQ